uniref:Transposase, mutator type n=1 Tax=Tanacetum cinerariifolium TaxID=118510 RepID=A0A6L2LKY6_TANCI|nr:transposase, mutator type [Tanacetum cinerariifolium]
MTTVASPCNMISFSDFLLGENLTFSKKTKKNMDQMNSWKWVLEKCELDEIDQFEFMSVMKVKNVGFVGDSLNENFVENKFLVLLHRSSLLLHLPLTHAILVVVLPRLIMEKLSFDLNVPKESSDSDEAAQYVSFVIHHGGCFTPTPSRSYVGGHVSSVDVVNIYEFCLHDLEEMVVKLGYGVADLMYYHFLRPRLGLDYGLHHLIVDADVLELAKYVKDSKIILVYVEHGSANVDSSIFVTPKKRVAIAIDNHF